MERSIKQTTFYRPPSEQLKRVAGYARVSSGKDAMLHSLSAQVSYYSEFIQKHRGWAYVGVYADEAKTGTKDEREIDFVMTISIFPAWQSASSRWKLSRSSFVPVFVSSA